MSSLLSDPLGRPLPKKQKKAPDPARVRRGRLSRQRGNAYEREVAKVLGGERVGMYGTKTDVSVKHTFHVQCKCGATYPERIDGWLRSIEFEAGTLRAVALGDAPGQGKKRRNLIVFDLEEFAKWYEGVTHDA